MIYYDKAEVSEGIDFNKTSEWKECHIYHYWYFLKQGFKFQPNVSNRCHDLLMTSMNLSDITILKIKNLDYRCIITGIRKREAIKLLQYIDLTEKVEHYKYQEHIWCYKFTRNSNLMKKWKIINWKKYNKIWSYI